MGIIIIPGIYPPSAFPATGLIGRRKDNADDLSGVSNSLEWQRWNRGVAAAAIGSLNIWGTMLIGYQDASPRTENADFRNCQSFS